MYDDGCNILHQQLIDIGYGVFNGINDKTVDLALSSATRLPATHLIHKNERDLHLDI